MSIYKEASKRNFHTTDDCDAAAEPAPHVAVVLRRWPNKRADATTVDWIETKGRAVMIADTSMRQSSSSSWSLSLLPRKTGSNLKSFTIVHSPLSPINPVAFSSPSSNAVFLQSGSRQQGGVPECAHGKRLSSCLCVCVCVCVCRITVSDSWR